MKANVEVICCKSKPLKDGYFPLMLRVTKDRKRKYVSLGLSLHEKFWDFEKGKPKRNYPDKEQIGTADSGQNSRVQPSRNAKLSQNHYQHALYRTLTLHPYTPPSAAIRKVGACRRRKGRRERAMERTTEGATEGISG